MKFLAAAAAIASSLMLSGCLVVDADITERHWDNDDYGYLLGADISARAPEITITAHSNGCTQKEHFEPTVRDRGDQRFDVGFRRTTPDNCKALVPDGRSMTWTFSELGIPANARLMLMNSIGR
ncbi:MAG: hypothetical protein Q8R02_06240 [Hyphomonadaceae bacterium]|nr:hypothetical protein [Hyphomonadaceae bacterium]